ncbi:hypothetical protein ACOME3_008654 [Neoechinorhynchus agilis]
MTRSSPNQNDSAVPSVIHDSRRGHSYARGRFLGKGGFARCYELTDLQTSCVYAGKIVSKTLLVKSHHVQKMLQEIEIHRKLRHPNIVRFHSFFEDDSNVYIVMEICRRRSLMELQKRRKCVTEPEAKYFLHQITDALGYLHTERVIHRDLKLGNLFINDEMLIKVGDFGLAAQLRYDTERKRTLCGTPNYIAPEVLAKSGHSYEVDIWSLGCILYTLLMGSPPFETNTLKDTYMRIKNNDYYLPAGAVSLAADSLIRAMLHRDPTKRPTVAMIKNSAFLVEGYCPSKLPASCCSIAPRHFDTEQMYSRFMQPLISGSAMSTCGKLPLSTNVSTRRPLLDCNYKSGNIPPLLNPILPVSLHRDCSRFRFKENMAQHVSKPMCSNQESRGMLESLSIQIKAVLEKFKSGQCFLEKLPEDAQDPSRVPFLWITRWVDYSDKYGLGYQLCDDSVGIIFNDNTRLIQPVIASSRLQYVDRDGLEYAVCMDAFPEVMFKKVTLFRFFKDYMDNNLVKAGRNIPVSKPIDEERLTRVPFLKAWFRTRNAIIMHLSNGILQVNFFKHHNKYILCPIMGAITMMSTKLNQFNVYPLDSLVKYGCTKRLFAHLRYIHCMITNILDAKSSAKMGTMSDNNVPTADICTTTTENGNGATTTATGEDGSSLTLPTTVW